MFFGQFEHSIDAKGRLTIPSKYRKELGDSFYVTLGLDKCLYLLTERVWEVEYNRRLAASTKSKSGRALLRSFTSNSSMVEPDKNGRILLSKNLRSIVGLEKDCVVTGVGNRVEIWDRKTFESDVTLNVDQITSLTSDVHNQGIEL